mgnify:CR=1 FL=1
MLKILLVLVSFGCAASAYAIDGGELLEKVDRHLAPASYELYRKLINIEPDGRAQVETEKRHRHPIEVVKDGGAFEGPMYGTYAADQIAVDGLE